MVRGVRLIDGIADAARPNVDVTVDDGRITAIDGASSTPPPDGTTVIDGAGQTLLPGLIDCHSHYPIDTTVDDGFATFRHDPDALIALRAAGAARRALELGVTTARSAGSPGSFDYVLRDAIAAGFVPGPRLLAAGPAMTITGGHGWPFGREADSVVEFVRGVRANVRDGAEVIKAVASEAAMLSGWDQGAGGAEMTEEELKAVVDEAARLHRRVLAHAQGGEAVRRAARAGVASVEHAFLAEEADLEVLRASGATLVPTLSVTDVWRTIEGLTPVSRARQDLIEPLHRRSCETAIRMRHPDRHGHRLRGPRRDLRHGRARGPADPRARCVRDDRHPGRDEHRRPNARPRGGDRHGRDGQASRSAARRRRSAGRPALP